MTSFTRKQPLALSVLIALPPLFRTAPQALAAGTGNDVGQAPNSTCAQALPRTGGQTCSAAAIKVCMAGDSTMADATAQCPVDWGNQFDVLFNDDVTVVNSAMGGRSVQTWLYDPNVSGTKPPRRPAA